jgi:SRSO17 transposase
LATFVVVRSAFTQPSFLNFVSLAFGWILVPGRRAVTSALVVTGLSRDAHHAAYHRFFSRARWNPDEVGRRLFALVLRLVPPGTALTAVIDDTLARKKGPHVFGLGTHLDPVRSTRRVRIFCFGHVWVVLALVVRLPFSKRPWALPVLFRLYRSKKECEKNGGTYRKKTELAREMLDVLAGWLEGRRCEVAVDSAYCNDTVTRGLCDRIVLFSRMRPDAVLTAPPEPKVGKGSGRPAVRGRRLPTPEEVAQSEDVPWEQMSVSMYRSTRDVTYKTLSAQWYRACGGRLLRIVITRVTTGNVPWMVFLCTDPTVKPQHLLERYSSRWAIEVTFYDLKQYLGFGDSQAWTRQAVERTTPFVGMLFTLIVVWYATAGHGTSLALTPVRPWYRTKAGPSFADMLGAAQRAVIRSQIFDPACNSNNLQNFVQPSADAPPKGDEALSAVTQRAA